MIGLRQDCIYGRQLKTTCKNKISIVCSKIKYEIHHSKIIILTQTRLSKISLLHRNELVVVICILKFKQTLPKSASTDTG